MYKNNFAKQIFFVGADGLEPPTYAGYMIYSHAPFPAVQHSQIKKQEMFVYYLLPARNRTCILLVWRISKSQPLS